MDLQWALHGGEPTGVVIERRAGNSGRWERVATLAGVLRFLDTAPPRGVVCYRVRATNNAGESAFSNIVRVNR